VLVVPQRSAAVRGAVGFVLHDLALLYMGPNANIDVPASLNPRLALKLYEDNPELPLLRDCEERHPHRNVAFWDGAARRWWD
jgi:prepilin-type processing-associated H-X9-DG protein